MANDTETPAEGEPKKKKGKSHKLLIILLCLLAMGVLRTGFMFVIIGLMPAIVVHFLDQSRHRYTYKTVLCCNLSAMVPAIGKMLTMGPHSSVLQEIMGDGMNWLTIYAAAFGGILLINITPLIAQTMVMGFHQTKVTRLLSTQEKIEREWGQEVTQFSKPEDALR